MMSTTTTSSSSTTSTSAAAIAAAVAATTTSTTSQPFYFTIAAVVIPAITGSVSFVSSGTIIYVIVRSKIYSTYHRIMLGTSIADCIASLAIALTTLPMPKDVIYPFAGKSFGNIATCEAQGLAYLTGNTFVFCMSFLLNMFYLCSLTIWFTLKEEKFKWFVEVPLFLASLLISLLVPLVYFDKEVINPSPNDTFCSIYSYPQGCNKENNPSCRGGSMDLQGKFAKTYVPIMFITFLTLILTMVMVVVSFHRTEKGLRFKTTPARELTSAAETSSASAVERNTMMGEEDPQDSSLNENSSNGTPTTIDISMFRTFRRAQENKRIVTRQAIMYILAFFFSHGFTVLSYIDLRYHKYMSYTECIAILRIIFQPLQGFFNMLIFLHHKVHSIRRENPNESFAQALRTVFLSPKTVEDPIVSSIEIVMMNDYMQRKSHVRPLRRHRRGLDVADNDNLFNVEDQASYSDQLSISEMEESVNSEFDYVSRVNDSSFHGSQPTIHSLIMDGTDFSYQTRPSLGSVPKVMDSS